MNPTPNQIIYTGIVKDKKSILCDYSQASGNYVQFVLTVLSKVRWAIHTRSKGRTPRNPSNTINMASTSSLTTTSRSCSWRTKNSNSEWHSLASRTSRTPSTSDSPKPKGSVPSRTPSRMISVRLLVHTYTCRISGTKSNTTTLRNQINSSKSKTTSMPPKTSWWRTSISYSNEERS